MFGVFSYWILPLFAACVWLGMLSAAFDICNPRLTRVTTATLLGMLGTWLAKGSPLYVSMEQGQTIAYISDIGATGLQPLFIAGSAVSVVVFDVCFVSERWLRHKGRLAHNTSTVQKVLSGFACAFAIIGAIGLILLTILDTVSHPTAHDICLVIFMYVSVFHTLYHACC
ncbi:unnamed protein product [Aureobasidium vineae]|uniref:CWH43-like N-terminal domain-containing protein n=1 Tax=Aureobasidium vineae TaxID=2773715 RepID=A0A9N8JP52_9PEZI|nr:unnamed protein product [Aureobasidium vineae]